MRRKTSDRNKSKSTPEKSPEKSSRKSHRHSRRRRKSSSSSSEDEKPLKKSSSDVKVSEPKVLDQKRESNKETAEAVVKPDIESDLCAGSSKKSIKKIVLPNETTEMKSALVPEETPSKEEKPSEWKEDSEFWNASTEVKVETTDATSKEKDGGSLWKVQTANGAGGEIQKLKICRQRPPETSESGDSGKRRSSRPSDGGTSSRSTDESVHEDGDKDMKKSKLRTRTSSRNSPSLSESSKVVCDVSEESPTKIKIINVSNLSLDKKSADDSESIKEIPPPIGVNENSKIEQVENSQQINHEVLSVDIPLPSDDQVKISNEVESDQKQENNTIPSLDEIQTPPEKDNSPSIEHTIKPLVENSAETNDKSSMSIDLSEIPEPPNEPKRHKMPQVEDKVDVKEDGDKASQRKSTKINTRKKQDSDSGSRSSRSSSRSSSNSDSDASKEHRSPRQRTRVKLKRRITKQSSETQHRTSGSPKKESSDSEEEIKKEEKEEDKLRQTENNMNRENGPNLSTEIGEEGEGITEQVKVPRKRRWGASKSIRPTKKPLVSISTNSLKDLVPGAKPVSAEELQLSVEEEEGQLDDDDDDDDEVTILAIEEKVEEKPKEQEREKEEKKRESRREREKIEEERRKRSEKREKIKPEQPSVNEKSGSQRKILLLTDDARKLARSPSPPRRRPSSVLYITNLVRPFTVQQLRNLLLRTGAIAENGFWMDSIKSKCYVEYTTEDAAVETRHALHGVRWPVSNPKTLIVEFSTHDDMSVAQALAEETEPIPRKAEPLILDRSVEGWLSEQARLKGERPARRVMAAVREWDVGKPEHPDEIIEQDLRLKERQREQERRVRKERSHRSATPDTAEPPVRKPRRKEEDAPAKLLDDLFRKTKSSPCIYWLPLTQEQIVVKEEMRRQHMAEHERRVAEIKKADQARRDRERRNRK